MQEVRAAEIRTRVHEREYVLELIAEAEGAAGLIGPAARPHATAQGLARVPDPELSRVGAQRALSTRRRLRLPRSTPGRTRAHARASGSLPRAPPACGVT